MPTLTKIKPFTILSVLLFVSIIGILIGLIFLHYGHKPPPSLKFAAPTPTASPVAGPQPRQVANFAEEFRRISPLIPYTGPSYRYLIQYNEEVGIITIAIDAQNREDFTRIRKAAEDFLKSLGVEDICALNIFWKLSLNSPLRAREIFPFEYITTGCPVLPGLKP